MDRAALIVQLVRHEALRLKPYVDTVGKITLGVGRNLTDVGISRDEALMLLDHDLDVVLADLATFAWWAGLSETRQLALADMRFNLGANGFRGFRVMLHALSVGNYPDVAMAMRSSQWFRQVGLRGVDLVQMMEQG